MAKFYIDSTALKKSPRQIDEIYKVLNSSEKILKNISLTNWPEAEMQSLADSVGEIAKDVKDEAKSVQDLSEVLSKIITTYEDSEASLVAKKNTVDQNKVPGKSKDGASDPLEALKNSMSPEAWDLLMFIAGLIPGLNILVDGISLIDDIQKFMKDGKIDAGEAGVLALDVISLGADIFSFGSICKAIKSAKTMEKVAQTTAKETARVAEKNALKKEATEQAAKSAVEKSAEATAKAERAAKAAENVDKSTKAGRQIVKDAKTAARNADKAADAAKSAEKTAKEAADKSARAAAKRAAAEEAAEKAHRNVYRTVEEEMKKGTWDNLKDKADPENIMSDSASDSIREQSESDE